MQSGQLNAVVSEPGPCNGGSCTCAFQEHGGDLRLQHLLMRRVKTPPSVSMPSDSGVTSSSSTSVMLPASTPPCTPHGRQHTATALGRHEPGSHGLNQAAVAMRHPQGRPGRSTDLDGGAHGDDLIRVHPPRRLLAEQLPHYLAHLCAVTLRRREQCSRSSDPGPQDLSLDTVSKADPQPDA